MTLKQADHIRQDWGKFLEITNGHLIGLFLTNIPERLLPYKKEVILEALNMLIEYCKSNGDTESINLIKNTIPSLDWYVNDSEALATAAKNFNDKVYLDLFKKTDESQQKQYDYVLANY